MKLNDYLVSRRKTIESSIASEVLAGNTFKEHCERSALAEITALECELAAPSAESLPPAPNSAMDAMQRLISLVDLCESADDFRFRAFVIINKYRAAQHQ